MREIKLRGKRIDNGEWVHGGIAFWENDIIYITNPNIVYRAVLWLNEVNPGTVCQYTGLKDKNGVEIYEFDYITADESVWHGKIKGLVMWNDKMCGFRVIDEVTEDEVSLNNCSNIEVVGHYFEVDE